MPQPVRWALWCWLAAVAAGVVETALHASSREDFDLITQLSVRAVVYLLVIVVILQLRRARNWARITLTVLLGGFGLASLLAEPISWLAAGGNAAAFWAAADATTVAVVALRALHVVAVLAALPLMYTPTANRFFGKTVVRSQVA